ncbi:formyl transferase [Campylobacter upsaliensis]|nr:formyl transferase [Campylobacter upsaliensis]
MRFEKIVCLGEGKFSLQCQKIAENFFACPVELLQNDNIKELDGFFASLKNALIISANNTFYLFKKPCIANNTIINYHNSLLPKHRGLNAHIWTIFEDDVKTGISWHKVDEGIDTGDLIIQKEIVLDESFTALSLLRMQYNLALSSLEEALRNLMLNRVKPQNIEALYHSKNEFPNEGYLDLAWEEAKICRFLRAMDCGSHQAQLRLLGRDLKIFYYDLENFNLFLSNDIKLHIKKDKNATN